ncbi:Sec-independent periplasmic protein translocase [Hibiscus syriacus]|uniref:Sec-independent periplasmic protein translocase n=1 Tax=Hibiscus syriacus TaxID=106335 RepID=A0A6A2ZLJ7_HIBSY|nr:Sec-independent periplasmic protein translocase [Hibiscus syriacus]
MLDQAPPSMEKVAWVKVIQIGDQVPSKLLSGMLWNGESPDAKQVEETMNSFFNALQGFLLLSHGSNVGSGATLSSSIHESVKHVVDCCFRLMKEHVSLYGSRNKEKKLSMPQFVGAVWEACSALKKVPTTNVIAIGHAMTQVAVSLKDVVPESKPEDDDLSDDDLGSDLSPEEMKAAQLAQGVVSETLLVIKELIHIITGMLKLETQMSMSRCRGLRRIENRLKQMESELDCFSTTELTNKMQNMMSSIKYIKR